MDTSFLIAKLKRLLIDDKKKQQLIEELRTMNENGKKKLAEFIEQQDQETLKILEKKRKERQSEKSKIEQFQTTIARLKTTKKDLKNLEDVARFVFSDQRALASLIDISDDNFLVALQQAFEEFLKSKPKQQEAMRLFFTEMRLQKYAIEKKRKEEKKKKMDDAIAAIEKESSQLDQIIAAAKRELAY